MHISLPKPMKQWVDEQVDRGGYGTASEYVRQLLREEQQRRLRERIDANLLDSIQSGRASPMTRRDWQDIRREGRRRRTTRKPK